MVFVAFVLCEGFLARVIGFRQRLVMLCDVLKALLFSEMRNSLRAVLSAVYVARNTGLGT